MMTLLSDSAFTIVDFVAQRLVYVSWIPMVAAFLTLCLSSDKERQFARIAKISRFIYLGAIALYLSYFILHPKARYYSFVNSPFLVTQLFMIFTSPVFWLFYGDNAISVDVKAYYSRRLVIDQIVKSKILRHICFEGLHLCEVFGTLGFGSLVAVSLAIPMTDEALTDGANVSANIAALFAYLVSFGYMAQMKNKDTQNRIAEELSAEGSVVETKADVANEEVPDQANKQA